MCVNTIGCEIIANENIVKLLFVEVLVIIQTFGVAQLLFMKTVSNVKLLFTEV